MKRENRPMEWYQYKPMTENPIVLDFSDVKCWDDLHDLFKEKFGFPEYYGRNWSALSDCLWDRFVNEDNYIVELHGFLSLNEDMAENCRIMLEIFREAHTQTPNVKFVLVS